MTEQNVVDILLVEDNPNDVELTFFKELGLYWLVINQPPT
jgi:hypothetical protein